MASLIEQNQMDLIIFLRDPVVQNGMTRMLTVSSTCVTPTISRWPPIWPQRNY